MHKTIKVADTSWPNIRVVLYQRHDGLFQFVQEHMSPDDHGETAWCQNQVSGLYNDVETAQSDMMSFIEELEKT